MTPHLGTNFGWEKDLKLGELCRNFLLACVLKEQHSFVLFFSFLQMTH